MRFKVVVIIFVTAVTLLSCTERTLNIPQVTSPVLESVTTLGGSLNEVARSVVVTSDGGYAVLGYSQSNDGALFGKINTSFDYYVLKYSSSNTLEWFKTYGGSNDDRGSSIIQTTDGGYAIFGYSNSNDLDVTDNAGGRDFWLVKLASNGNLLWQKTYGYIGKDDGQIIIQTKDGGFLIAGELDVTSSGGEGNSQAKIQHAGGDYWVLKLDSFGAIEWSKYYGGNFTDTPRGIAVSNDGGYVIVGTSDSTDVDISNNKGTYDFWVIKISPTGTLLWEKNFGGSQIDEARGIIKTDDGNFLVVGDTTSTDSDVSANNGGADLWVLKIDNEGNLLWEKNYGGRSFDVARSIKKTNSGGFIISGSSRSSDNDFTNNGQNDGLLMILTQDGDVEWQYTIGGSDIDFLYDAVQLPNGTFVGVGESSSADIQISENKGFSDLLIITLK